LRARGGVFIVPGDVDQPPERLLRLAEGTAMTPLFNQTASVRVGRLRLRIGGVALDYRSDRSRRAIHELESAGDASEVRILLAHRPDVVFELGSRSAIDLVVAGHTHGGQIVVPFYGPPMTLSSIPRSAAAGGLHTVDGHKLYVSRGVGCERGQAPRIRLFCPPEVSIVTVELPGRVEAEEQQVDSIP
jgi:predicted MPP superfamily phosphohydrolase